MPPQEERARATADMHENFDIISHVVLEISVHADRQTHKTDGQTHVPIAILRYSTPLLRRRKHASSSTSTVDLLYASVLTLKYK